MRANPLVVLGIPTAILMRERQREGYKTVLKLAELNFRSLSKFYHPDMPDGDAELMTEFGQAIDEIRDLDALQYYIDELVGENEMHSHDSKLEMKQIFQGHEQTIKRLAAAAENVDMLQLFDSDSAISCLINFWSYRAVLEVNSPHKAQLKIVDSELIASLSLDAQSNSASLHEGVWREEYFDGDRLTTVSYDTFAAQHNVQVLGFAPSEMSHESHLSSVGQSLERSWLQPTLAWDNPVQAWYMPHLSKKFEDGSAVVLCHKGQVSHVGRIIALAEKIN